MATMYFAVWLQDADLASTNRLIMIFIGLVAAAMVVQAVAMVSTSVKTGKAVKALKETAEELKAKMIPLIDVAMEISRTSQALLHDAAPKVKRITENLVETSDTLVETSKAARSAVAQFDCTMADVNRRAQRQVARVDGMVTATLTATAEMAEAVSKGIRVPAQKVAVMAAQAKGFAEGVLAKIKSMAAGSE